MLYQTRGIVLNFIRYRETSIIVKIYTEKFGLQSYIVNGVRSAKSKGKIALYQPLTLLDLVVYHKQGTSLNRISECRCAFPFQDIPFHPIKTIVAIFLSEVLSKSLKEETEDLPLFNFLHSSIIDFDIIPKNYENFHLLFLIKLSGFLGFQPASLKDLFLEIKNIRKIKEFEEEELHICQLLFEASFGEVIKIKNSIRRNFLDILILFYQVHIDHWGELKSMPVLQEILRES
jgi:DNA repair protein RecO (recombination protein O)